jgi:hypothetical protein
VNLLRILVAVIAGFLVMVIWVMGMTILSVLVLEPELIRGSEPTQLRAGFWVLNIGMSFLGAVMGGGAAALIAGPRRARAINILAAFVLALGIILGAGSAAERDVAAAGDAMYEPAWYSWAIPFVGAAGVLVGGALAGRYMARRRSLAPSG